MSGKAKSLTFFMKRVLKLFLALMIPFLGWSQVPNISAVSPTSGKAGSSKIENTDSSKENENKDRQSGFVRIMLLDKFTVYLGPSLSLFEMNCNKLRGINHSAGHHKIRHADGGRTVPSNHAEVCLTCHNKLHSKD